MYRFQLARYVKAQAGLAPGLQDPVAQQLAVEGVAGQDHRVHRVFFFRELLPGRVVVVLALPAVFAGWAHHQKNK